MKEIDLKVFIKKQYHNLKEFEVDDCIDAIIKYQEQEKIDLEKKSDGRKYL